MDNKLKIIITKLIESKTKDADKYVHNGSTWLIFSDEKKWVIELTKERTLWYNYYFFKRVFDYFKFDVIENQHIITEWVENTIQMASTQIIEDTIQNGVKHIARNNACADWEIEDTIQNGVRDTQDGFSLHEYKAEEIIQNEVKDTKVFYGCLPQDVEDTIQNGVKHIHHSLLYTQAFVEDTIENGVKHTSPWQFPKRHTVEDTIQNGVKHTQPLPAYMPESVEDTIQNGVKRTEPGLKSTLFSVEYTIQNGVKETCDWRLDSSHNVEDTIKNGVKYTGDRQGNYNLVVEDTIQNGVKKTYSDKIPHEYDWTNQFTEEIDDIIKNGVKETKEEPSQRTWMSQQVIENGVKKTVDALSSRLPNPVDDVVENGIKQIKSVSDKIGDVLDSSIGVHTYADEPTQNSWVNTVLENGIKGTYAWDDDILGEPDKLPKVINEGIIETYDDVYHHKGRVEGVIKNGVKEVQPLPTQDGNKDWGNYYHRQEDRTKPHTEYVNDAVRDGVKETWGYDKQSQVKVSNVVENGKKI